MSDQDWLARTYQLREAANPLGEAGVAVKGPGALLTATCPTFTPGSRALQSPVTTLLHHLAVEETDGASIYATCPPSEMCKGMAMLYGVSAIVYASASGDIMAFYPSKTGGLAANKGKFVKPAAQTPPTVPATLAGARRVSALKPFTAFPVPAAVEDLPMKKLIPDQNTLDRFFTFIVLEIARRCFGSKEAVDEKNRSAQNYGKNIASLLVDGDGTVLSWGVNTNTNEKWRHAEVNTLCNHVGLNRDVIPSGATLYTTLQPCYMCAGLVAHLAQGAKLRIVEAMADTTLGTTALTKPPEGLKVVTSPAAFGLSKATNAPLKDPVRIHDLLGAEYEKWRKSPAGANVPMTQFFGSLDFLSKVESARQHWFQVLWDEAEASFAKSYPEFCKLSRGTTEVKVGWAKKNVDDENKAVKLGDLLKEPKHQAAMEALALAYRNLVAVHGAFDAYLRGTAAALQ